MTEDDIELLQSGKVFGGEKVRVKLYRDGNQKVVHPLYVSKYSNKQRRFDERDVMFNEFFKQAQIKELVIYEKKAKNSAAKAYILDCLEKMFSNYGDNYEYMQDRFERCLKNFYLRKKRYRRKVQFNNFNTYWNYFVTYTYDEILHDEESFKKSLKKCLSNLQTRRGWRIILVWEYSESGRLHAHAIAHIPYGELLGINRKIEFYSTRHNKMYTRTENTFFRDRFGINDFVKIDEHVLAKYGQVVSYLEKYLEKTDEPIFYSKGIPSEVEIEVTGDNVCSIMLDFIKKYCLFDNFEIPEEILRSARGEHRVRKRVA